MAEDAGRDALLAPLGKHRKAGAACGGAGRRALVSGLSCGVGGLGSESSAHSARCHQRFRRTACSMVSYERDSQGVSLVEALLVAAVVSILVMLGLPMYQEQVRTLRRSEATTSLLFLAVRMEQYYAHRRTFVGASARDLLGSTTTPSGRYVISIPKDQLRPQAYVLRADPNTVGQARDPCGSFVLTSQGRRTATGAGESGASCWR